MTKVVVEILNDSLLSFYNPDTMKKEWYECEFFRGDKIEFLDIIWGGFESIMFVCLDGEFGKLPTKDCRIL